MNNNFFKNFEIGRKAIAQEYIKKYEHGLGGIVLSDDGEIIITKFKDIVLRNIIYYLIEKNESFKNIVFKFEGKEELKISINIINFRYEGLDKFIDILNSLNCIIVGLDEIIVTNEMFYTYAVLENHKRDGWKIKRLYE